MVTFVGVDGTFTFFALFNCFEERWHQQWQLYNSPELLASSQITTYTDNLASTAKYGSERLTLEPLITVQILYVEASELFQNVKFNKTVNDRRER